MGQQKGIRLLREMTSVGVLVVVLLVEQRHSVVQALRFQPEGHETWPEWDSAESALTEKANNLEGYDGFDFDESDYSDTPSFAESKSGSKLTPYHQFMPIGQSFLAAKMVVIPRRNTFREMLPHIRVARSIHEPWLPIADLSFSSEAEESSYDAVVKAAASKSLVLGSESEFNTPALMKFSPDSLPLFVQRSPSSIPTKLSGDGMLRRVRRPP